MRLIHPLAAIALLAIPTTAVAQAAVTQAAVTQAADTGRAAASTAAPPSPAATAPPLKTGLTVKDKDGKPIGRVTALKTDPSGRTVATIRMGADTFGVNASALAVDNDAATLNFTRSQLNSYLGKGQ